MSEGQLTRTQQKLFLQRDFSLAEETKYDLKSFEKINRIYNNIALTSDPVKDSWSRIMKSIYDVDEIDTVPIVDSKTNEIAEAFVKNISKETSTQLRNAI